MDAKIFARILSDKAVNKLEQIQPSSDALDRFRKVHQSGKATEKK